MKRSLNRLMGIKMMIPVMKLIMNSSDKQKCSIFCYRKVTRLSIQLRRPTATLPCLVACLCNHSLREHEVTCFTNTRWCALVTGSLEGLLSLFCGPQIPEMHEISSYTIKFVLSESLCVCVVSFTLPKMGTRWCSHMENMSMSFTITISSWSSSKMASFSTSEEKNGRD